MKKQVLVTGGAGFIGSHLIELLLQFPEEYQLIVFDNLSSGSLKNLPPNITFIKGDVRSEDLEAVFKNYSIDTVVHLAAQTMVSYSIDNPDIDAQINISGGINLLQNMLKYGVANIIFSSSAAVYGDGLPLPIKEAYLPKPTSFYGLSKLTFENYLAIYSQISNIHATVLRFANVYGPRQGDSGEGGVISVYTKNIINHQPLTVFGDGLQTRDFIYVADIAKAIRHCIDTPQKNIIYNVSTNKQTSLGELIATFSKILDRKLQINYLPAKTGDIYKSVLDNKRLLQLKVELNTSLETGLKFTLDSFSNCER